jgi:hypothetical protein
MYRGSQLKALLGMRCSPALKRLCPLLGDRHMLWFGHGISFPTTGLPSALNTNDP